MSGKYNFGLPFNGVNSFRRLESCERAKIFLCLLHHTTLNHPQLQHTLSCAYPRQLPSVTLIALANGGVAVKQSVQAPCRC